MTYLNDSIRQSERTFLQYFLLDPLTAFFAFLMWIIFKLLTVKIAAAIGGGMGGIFGLLAYRRNHIALVNLKIAFPEKTEREQKKIIRKMWQHWGKFYAEMPHAKKLYRKANIVGLEHLKQAVKDGKGGFICSAHLGNWELAVSQPLFDDFYLNPVYRRANNPWLDKLMFQRRKGVLIPKGQAGARKILEVLKNKQFIVMLCDQKLREGISVPFFGKPAMTASAIAGLALKFKTPILMARSIRQADGNFLVEVSEPISFPNETDNEKAVYQIMLTINQIYEKWIRENPEQWLWIHRRFDKSNY